MRLLPLLVMELPGVCCLTSPEGGVPYTRPSRIYVGLTARFTLGSTPVLRFGFVGFASGLVGIRTGLVRISGFVPDFVPKSNESPLGATWGLFWPF